MSRNQASIASAGYWFLRPIEDRGKRNRRGREANDLTTGEGYAILELQDGTRKMVFGLQHYPEGHKAKCWFCGHVIGEPNKDGLLAGKLQCKRCNKKNLVK